MLNELSLKLVDLQSSFDNLEQKIILGKQETVLPEKIIEGNTEFFINSGLYR